MASLCTRAVPSSGPVAPALCVCVWRGGGGHTRVQFQDREGKYCEIRNSLKSALRDLDQSLWSIKSNSEIHAFQLQGLKRKNILFP